MPSERDFLDAILAAPEDDSPRLIYADWLEERGDVARTARASFIRAQCELAHTDACPEYGNWRCTCQTCQLLRQEEEAWLAGRDYWPDELPFVIRGDATNELSCWQRGFVEEITLRLSDWLAHGRELVQATPLRTVRLTCEWATLQDSVSREYERRMNSALRRLAQDDEPQDNPVCRLHTLDLSHLAMDRWELNRTMYLAYRPWRGLRRLILPNWANLEERYRPYEIEQWKKRVPTLESVEFGRAASQGGADASDPA